MKAPLLADAGRRRYDALIGVGGIGAGTFFRLRGNETLGREESRAGRFLDQRDYCKLHIIAHNAGALLGPSFPVIPIGRVGDDETGRRIVAEMRAAGMDVRYVEICPGEQTLFSICFQYPDGTGGNLTTEDSACSRVDAAFVERARPDFERYRGRGVALAAPETPLESRAALLRMATAHGFFRAASFTSLEAPVAMENGLFGELDLLAINRSEAEALLRTGPNELEPPDLAARTVEKLAWEYPRLRVSVTAGSAGNWFWDAANLHYMPALQAEVRNSAGAGDAHLGALLAGIIAGLGSAEAHRLAGVVASYSVTSPHTIHPDLDAGSLREFAARAGVELP
jgi:ribokinase